MGCTFQHRGIITVALFTKHGSFSMPATTGSQTISGLGFSPKAIIFTFNGNTSDGSMTDGALGIGFLTGNGQNSLGYRATNNVMPSITRQSQDSSDCLVINNDVTGSVIIVNANGKLLSDGFSLTYTQTVSNTIVNYLAIGGNDLTNAKALVENSPASTGVTNFTSVGFKPSGVLMLAPNTGTVNNYFGISSFDGNNQWANTIVNAHNVTPSRTLRLQVTNSCYLVGNTGLTIRSNANFSSWLNNGFSLNFTTTFAAYPIYYLCLAGVQIKVGSFTKRSGVGSQSVTGLGFKPKSILLTSVGNTTSGSAANEGRISLGMSDGNTMSNVFMGGRNGVNPTSESQDLDRTKIMKIMTPNGATPSIQAAASIASFDNDGFTLNWDTNDTVATEILYFAIGQNASFATNSSSFGPFF